MAVLSEGKKGYKESAMDGLEWRRERSREGDRISARETDGSREDGAAEDTPPAEVAEA